MRLLRCLLLGHPIEPEHFHNYKALGLGKFCLRIVDVKPAHDVLLCIELESEVVLARQREPLLDIHYGNFFKSLAGYCEHVVMRLSGISSALGVKPLVVFG